MKTFKYIDILLQSGIILGASVLIFIRPVAAGILLFFGLLLWDLLSLFINLFLPFPKKWRRQRMAVWIHTAILTAFTLCIFLFVPPAPVVYVHICYALMLGSYYLFLCYRELARLRELRDQVSLIDVQHH